MLVSLSTIVLSWVADKISVDKKTGFCTHDSGLGLFLIFLLTKFVIVLNYPPSIVA